MKIPQFKKALKYIFAVMISLVFVMNVSAESFFTDVVKDDLFHPYIELLYEKAMLNGYSIAGKATGEFKPKDSIKRAEFTKLTTTTRLAEYYGLQEKWPEKSRAVVGLTIYNKLKDFYQCNNFDRDENCDDNELAGKTNTCNVCQSIGNVPYDDVGETNYACIIERVETGAGDCGVWYIPFLYFSTWKGYVNGYIENGVHNFKGENTILRIHALKMLLVENGNLPIEDLESDERFSRLVQKTIDNKSLSTKCLQGARNLILNNNGGENNEGARKLYIYALLADRLDLFGNSCQVFGDATGPFQRAEFLQQPLTRQEAARYFALTIDYKPATIDPEDDETVNDEDENEDTEASKPPVEGECEDIGCNTIEPEEGWEDPIIIPNDPNDPTNPDDTNDQNNTNDPSDSTSSDNSNDSTNSGDANNTNNSDNQGDTNNLNDEYPFSISEKIGTDIRLCTDTVLDDCEVVILSEDMHVNEDSIIGEESVNDSPLWNEVQYMGDTKYMPFGDLLDDDDRIVNNVFLENKQETNIEIQEEDESQPSYTLKSGDISPIKTGDSSIISKINRTFNPFVSKKIATFSFLILLLIIIALVVYIKRKIDEKKRKLNEKLKSKFSKFNK